MPTIRQAVEPTLHRLQELNHATATELRGGAYCASIERAEDGEPWIQLKLGAANIFYPFDDDPVERLKSMVASTPSDIVCMEWQAWKYATFEFIDLSPADAATWVQELFVSLYEFEAVTEVTVETFDMR